MDNLKELSTEELLEMLATYTADYTQLVRNGAPNIELTSCEIVLRFVQDELQLRSVSTTDFQFKSNNTGNGGEFSSDSSL